MNFDLTVALESGGHQSQKDSSSGDVWGMSVHNFMAIKHEVEIFQCGSKWRTDRQTGCVGFHQMMSGASRSIDSCLFLRPEEAPYQRTKSLGSSFTAPSDPCPLHLPPFLPLFSTCFFHCFLLFSLSSSSSILLPHYSSCRRTGML